jgi:ElaB/YqjD/DUF883 family membrane-anchored ribosome-binding protein
MSDKLKNLSEAIEELERHPGVEDKLNKIKAQLEEIRDKVGDEVKKTKNSVEHQVRDNPWAALGIAGLVFLLIGFLLGSKGRGRD